MTTTHITPLRPRIQRIAAGNPQIETLIRRMADIAVLGLPKMYLEGEKAFCFTRKKDERGTIRCAGKSSRYGAMTVLGAQYLDEPLQRSLFGGQTAFEFTGRLIDGLTVDSNLGDLAVITWAAAEINHPRLTNVLEMLKTRIRGLVGCPTVQVAWILSALVAAHRQPDLGACCQIARDMLLGALSPQAGIFPHAIGLRRGLLPRNHVGCFADQVYPIQALARYHTAFGHPASLNAAARAAEQICRLQGSGGQWWWHYDSRTGNVVEGYPVYSVHQDGMAPMALMDLTEAGGPDFTLPVRKGVEWMRRSPEIDRSLIDEPNLVIWRKVARNDPKKLVRVLRAGAGKLSPNLRLNFLNSVFPPKTIDFECRPYHFGWICYAWLRPEKRRSYNDQ